MNTTKTASDFGPDMSANALNKRMIECVALQGVLRDRLQVLRIRMSQAYNAKDILPVARDLAEVSQQILDAEQKGRELFVAIRNS